MEGMGLLCVLCTGLGLLLAAAFAPFCWSLGASRGKEVTLWRMELRVDNVSFLFFSVLRKRKSVFGHTEETLWIRFVLGFGIIKGTLGTP